MDNDLIRRARTEHTPLIDGDQVTFVWEGKNPPEIAGDFNDWEETGRLCLTEVEPQVWAAKLELPSDAYMEYAFFWRDTRLADPFNPRLIHNGLGKRNHFFYMPNAEPTDLIKRQKGVPRGEVTRQRIDTGNLITGKYRSVYFYNPPVESSVPLLVVWDGMDYLYRAWLARIVDNLIAQERIKPIAMALINTNGQSRLPELGCSEGMQAFLLHKVLPAAYSRLNLVDVDDNPGSWGLLGASMGGLMSLATGLRFPHIFGKVISQSGAFSQLTEPGLVFDLASLKKDPPLKIWMDVGAFESLVQENARLSNLLSEQGHDVLFHEYQGGHNYTCWRNEIWRGLEALFPGAKAAAFQQP